MIRTRLPEVACSIARSVDLFGDAWTTLIMRDVLVGVTRFDDLVEDLGASRKVLADRLARLVEHGVLIRRRYQENPPRDDYCPTQKGRELYPVLLALMEWGDRWRSEQPPVRLRHDDCGRETRVVAACAHCGGELTLENTEQLPGPGGAVGAGTRVIGPLIANRDSEQDTEGAGPEEEGLP